MDTRYDYGLTYRRYIAVKNNWPTGIFVTPTFCHTKKFVPAILTHIASLLAAPRKDPIVPILGTNNGITNGVFDRSVDLDKKVLTNIEEFGNMSAASIPCVLSDKIKKGVLKMPSTLLLCGFGAGMTSGTAIVKLRN